MSDGPEPQTGYVDEPLTALIHAAADRLAPIGRNLRESGWPTELIAHRYADGRVVMRVEVELATLRASTPETGETK